MARRRGGFPAMVVFSFDVSCWNWPGAISANGYGYLRHNGKDYPAHMYSYMPFVGEIPTGTVIDHLCRNRRCVNPGHLRVLSHADNVRAGLAGKYLANRTSCPQGHDYTAENTIFERTE